MSDVKRSHRFLRSLLVAGASLLIIVGGAFAGNALAPATPATEIAQPAVDDEGDSLEARDEDAPDVETPEPAETPEAAETPEPAETPEVDAPEAPPNAGDVNEDPGAQGDEDDQGEAEDADDANENDAKDANDDHDSGGEHESGDSGEHDSGDSGDDGGGD